MLVRNGSGPAPRQLRWLARFYRVDAARDRAHGGSAIGLAIARAIVEAHGGEITAASGGSGTGSTFSLTVPAAVSARMG